MARRPKIRAAGEDVADEMARFCIANRLRMLTRAITGIYDEALRPFGCRVTQSNLLIALVTSGGATPTRLAQTLKIEKSTLSRNLERMRRRGWLVAVPAEDGRSTVFRATPAGERLLLRLYPAWRRAQEKASRLLGGPSLRGLERMAASIRR